MNNNFNHKNLNSKAIELLKSQNIDPKNLNNIDTNKLLASLNKEDTEKINKLLNDKNALNSVLNSPKTVQIINNLFKNNGER